MPPDMTVCVIAIYQIMLTTHNYNGIVKHTMASGTKNCVLFSKPPRYSNMVVLSDLFTSCIASSRPYITLVVPYASSYHPLLMVLDIPYRRG